MEINDSVDASSANNLDLPRKKKKRKKSKPEALGEERCQESEDDLLHPPFPSTQESEDGRTPRKKSKKRKAREGSPDDSPSVEVEDGQNSEAEVVRACKKKKKRKHKSGLQDWDSTPGIPETPSEAIIRPETTDLEDCGYERPPAKKKKKRKRRVREQEIDGPFCVSETPEEANDLPEATGLEGAGGGCEDPPSKKKKKKKAKSKEVPASENSGLDAKYKTTLTQPPSLTQPDHSDPQPDPSCPSEGEGANEAEETEKTTSDNDSVQGGVTPELSASEEDRGILPPAAVEAQEGPSSRDLSGSETSSVLDEDLMADFSAPGLDYEAARKELEEFVPHVRNLTDSAVRQLASRDLERFKRFKEKGIAVKYGKFTRKEDRLLKGNIEAFLEETEIDSAEKLFFPHRFPDEKTAINKLKAKRQFCLKMAEGIARPWRLVYYRGRRLFDPQNHQGLYTEEAKKKLKKYQAMYGNSWTKISELMGRSSHSVEYKYSNIRYDPNAGPWSSEEIRKLIEAISEVLRPRAESALSTQDKKNGDQTLMLDRKMLYKGIPWCTIERKVGTRHWKQCRRKWHSFVVKKIISRQDDQLSGSIRFRINLIRRLYKADADEESEINWDDISKRVGNFPPDYLQGKYYRLKTTCVPFWNRKSFPEIIYYLYKKHLPRLKAQAASMPAAQKTKVTTKDSHGEEVFPFGFFFHSPAEDEADGSREEAEGIDDGGNCFPISHQR